MALNFNARIEEDLTRIEFRDETASIDIVTAKDSSSVKGEINKIYFLINKNSLIYIGKTVKIRREHKDKDFDKYICISVPTGIDISYLEHKYVALAEKNGIVLINKVKPSNHKNLSPNKEQNAIDFIVDVNLILEKFGYNFFKEKSTSKNRPLSAAEEAIEFREYKIITIGGRKTEIYVNNVLYEGNMSEKLREIAKNADIDYSDWAEYKKTGTVHFAKELMKTIKEQPNEH